MQCHHRESDIELVQLHADLTMLARPLGEPAEHSTEKRVAPGRLGEGARIPQKRRDAGFTACWVIAVDEVAEREEADVLGEGQANRELPGVDRDDPAGVMKCEPKQRSVQRVDREPGGAPAWAAARHCLAEDGDIGVVAAQKPLVERLF
jgi:hypothetical protein